MGDSNQKTAVFHQVFHRTEEVYNIAGDFYLTPKSTRGDLANAIDLLRDELEVAAAIPSDITKSVEKALADARGEALAGSTTLVESLEEAQRILTQSSGAVEQAITLGKSVGKLVAWATAFLM